MAIDKSQGQFSTDMLGEMGGTDAVVVDAAGATSLTIPGGSMMLVAEFTREGPDLIIEGPDGEEVIVRDYFTMEDPPTLQTEGGAQLTSDLVSRLAGSAAPQQFAADGEVQQAQPIGTIETVQGTVTAIRADGSRVTLQNGDQVYQGDVIETAGNGSIGMTFADGTTFSLGNEGRMVLDELIYDPETDEGTSAFSVVQGVFSFVSGSIAKSGSDAMTVRTPVATIGVRGTMVVATAAQKGEESSITLLQEEGGITGEIVVTNQADSQVLNVANQTTTVNSFFAAPTAPVVLPQSTIDSLYESAVNVRPEIDRDTDDIAEHRQGDRAEDDRSDAPAKEGAAAEDAETPEDEGSESEGSEEGVDAELELAAEGEGELEDAPVAAAAASDEVDASLGVTAGADNVDDSDAAVVKQTAEVDEVDLDLETVLTGDDGFDNGGIDGLVQVALETGADSDRIKLAEAAAQAALEAGVDPDQAFARVLSGEASLDEILQTDAGGEGTAFAIGNGEFQFGETNYVSFE